jgi:hypothetical protein
MGFRDCVENILYSAFFEKVNKGIIVNSPNGHRLAVAIHPYFEDRKDRRNFTIKMDDFIKNYKGPVLIFEEITKIGETYNHINILGIKGNRHFVITEFCAPYPFDINKDEYKWGNVLEKVNNLRNEKPVDLAGGYFYNDNIRKSHESWIGCLGIFASALIENNIPINFLDDLVFSR